MHIILGRQNIFIVLYSLIGIIITKLWLHSLLSSLFITRFLAFHTLFARMLCLPFVVEVFEVTVFAEALGVVRAVWMFTRDRFFRITFLVVAWVAHKFGTMPLFSVFAAEYIQFIYLFPVQIEPTADLFEVVLLHLANTILFDFFGIIIVHLDDWGSSFLLGNFIALGMVWVRFKQMESTFFE